MQKSNVVVGILAILMGCVIFYLSRDMSLLDEYGVPGERFWPYGLASLFILLGVLQWLEVVIVKIKKQPSVTVTLNSPAMLRAYLIAGVMLVYAVLLHYLGFLAASILLVPFVMWMMGEKRLWFLAITSVCIVGAVYLFFEVIFNSPLPVSIFYE